MTGALTGLAAAGYPERARGIRRNSGAGVREGTMAEEPFVAIEKRIGELAALVMRLREEKKVLAAELERKGTEARDLAARLEEMARERDDVRRRIDAILSRLENVEI